MCGSMSPLNTYSINKLMTMHYTEILSKHFGCRRHKFKNIFPPKQIFETTLVLFKFHTSSAILADFSQSKRHSSFYTDRFSIYKYSLEADRQSDNVLLSISNPFLILNGSHLLLGRDCKCSKRKSTFNGLKKQTRLWNNPTETYYFF